MKLTKRIKKWIIQSVIFGWVFFIILITIFITFAYPKIIEIDDKKQELAGVFEKYNTMLVSGIEYSEFKDIVLDGSETDYSKELLKNVSQDFYSLHLSNTKEKNYEDFLIKLSRDIAELKSSEAYLEKDKNLNVILPTYNWNNTAWGSVFWDDTTDQETYAENDTLTDFYFINYIENLLYSFNLSYDWDIGVWNISNVDENSLSDEKVQIDLLEENIYAIPLSFNLVGRKSDIVDFLHYFENVALIEISDEWFKVLNDGYITRKIEWSTASNTYNIYENQLADIVSLSLPEYPNSSVKTTESLRYAMKTLQWKERYEVEVEIQFYVAWVPGYKMQAYINTFLDQYTSFSASLKKDTQKFVAQKYKYSTSRELTAIGALQSLEALIIELEKDIIDLRKESAQAKNIEKTYNTATEYNKQLEKIKNSYDEQMKILIK